MEGLLIALAGGVVGGAFGCIATILSAYWGPRKLEERKERPGRGDQESGAGEVIPESRVFFVLIRI